VYPSRYSKLATERSGGLGSARGPPDLVPEVRALARLGTPEPGFTPTVGIEVVLATGSARVELDTSGTIGVAAERARLGKDLAAAEKEPAGTKAKLGNAKFTERAPAEMVAGIRGRRRTAEADIERVRRAGRARPVRPPGSRTSASRWRSLCYWPRSPLMRPSSARHDQPPSGPLTTSPPQSESRLNPGHLVNDEDDCSQKAVKNEMVSGGWRTIDGGFSTSARLGAS
jgi:hypothetical protein